MALHALREGLELEIVRLNTLGHDVDENIRVYVMAIQTLLTEKRP